MPRPRPAGSNPALREQPIARVKPTGVPKTIAALSRDLPPVIYFLRTRDDLIKVGWTEHLANRKAQLSIYGWDALLAVKAGTWDDEQALHRQLRPYLARGREYYHPVPEVIAVIDDVRSSFGLSLLAA